jgi:4-diphosphocytidyl-2-C-methyl-D-erythritol kinase
MDISSPAKINLFLQVTGKRTDGYHDIITLMCCIGLSDTIRLRFGEKRISVECPHPDVPEDQTNLACRAAELFFDSHRVKEGVHIAIDKTIPVGAGLGGGSSNAAAVLKGLNTHYGRPFSLRELSRMGRYTGADVPFFIAGRPAVASGIGDLLQPYDRLRPYPILLIFPSISVSTAEVYKKFNLRLTKNKKIINRAIFRSNWGKDAPELLHNDLEAAASAICPEIQEAKEALLRHGALGAAMSGSGSAVFGVFEDFEKAIDGRRAISKNRQWRLHLTRILD